MTVLTCDRIEEDTAVFTDDDGRVFRIKCALLPFEAAEGDVVRSELMSDGMPDAATITRDDEERLRRAAEIHSLFCKLKNKPRGDNK